MLRQTLLRIFVVAFLSTCSAEFEVQPYELPDDQGYRHITAMIHEQELIMFGGLGNGGPFPPTSMWPAHIWAAPPRQEDTARVSMPSRGATLRWGYR